MLTLSSPSGKLVMRVDTQSTWRAIVLTTLTVLPCSVVEQEPPSLHSTTTGVTHLRGILVIGLTKLSERWRELDDSITQWGNFVPLLTHRAT
jgi:hypothetical protein